MASPAALFSNFRQSLCSGVKHSIIQGRAASQPFAKVPFQPITQRLGKRRPGSSWVHTNASAPSRSLVKPLLAGAGILVCGTVGGLWYTGLITPDVLLGNDRNTEENRELKHFPQPEPMVHPYSLKPWYWQWYFFVKRSCFLLSVFAPLSLLMVRVWMYPNDEDLRKEWVAALVQALRDAGTTLTKFGQWISMRPDIFPEDLCDACAKLRQEVDPHSLEHTRMVIKEGLGMELEDIFEKFDEEPIASGCVGQVHHAILRDEFALQDGIKEVAVKVRHPKVMDETYLDAYFLFASVPFFQACGLMLAAPFNRSAYTSMLQQQLDFKWEAYHLSRFRHNFDNSAARARGVKFPIVAKQPLLADTVMVESWAPGTTIADMFQRFQSTESFDLRRKLAFIVFDTTIKMFLRDNYIHADLHAGNLLYDDTTGEVTFIDAGLTATLNDYDFAHFGNFLRALVVGDGDRIAEELTLFHDTVDTNRPPPPLDIFQKDVNELLLKFKDYGYPPGLVQKTERPVPLGDIVGQLCNLLGKHSMALRSDVASLITTISVSEGLILALDPTFDVMTHALPYFVKYRGWESVKQIRNADYV